MKQSDHIDDILLGAFVDGQLDTANSEAVITAMENDPGTRERVYQLRRAKDLIKLGFEHVEAPAQTSSRHPQKSFTERYSYGVAASLLVMATTAWSHPWPMSCWHRKAF